MVRAKFRVDRIEATQQQRRIDDEKGWDKENMETVEMRLIVMFPVSPTSNPNDENSKFWNASPSGELKLGTINPEAWKQFELGKNYYVDFTPTE